MLNNEASVLESFFYIFNMEDMCFSIFLDKYPKIIS
jgi:hypothetical protein